jgi:hypothetical protein
MESKSPLGGNLPGGFIFQPALITKTEGKACLSLADLAENRYIFPQFSCQGSINGSVWIFGSFPIQSKYAIRAVSE